MKRVTIKDIARELMLSVSTVSRAIVGDKNIRRETKERVLEAAERLGYRPNPVATSLQAGRTNAVGIIVPEMTTPFAAQIIDGVQEVLNSHGIKVVVANSHESWERERENISQLERFMVDGMIVGLCDYKQNREEYLRLQRSAMPLVFVDRIPHNMEVSQVIVDDYIKSFFLVEHLVRSGRKRIVYLGGPDYVYNSVERYRGYRDAMAKFGVEVDPQWVTQGGLSFEDGAASVRSLIESGVEFDAIFAFTDTLAIGAMNELREMGYSVPKDVAVAGFSGTVLSTIVHPQLTTIEAPLRQMGVEAAKLILEKILKPRPPKRSIVLDAEIKYRASTEQ
ncbi:MAG: LacI family DNA-binding transcriptional regulator [Rikenellaceae bacterium]